MRTATDNAKIMLKRKITYLREIGVPENGISIALFGAMYYESQDGIPMTDYWLDSKSVTMRDELLLIANSYFSLAGMITQLKCRSEWAQMFRVAYLFRLKANAQSLISIDRLNQMHCYGDALSIVRTMHSRINLLLLFSLNPCLHNEWLSDPKNSKYLDGKVREILTSTGLNTMGHMYEHFSEIIHGQYQALSEIGYMEQGLFSNVTAIETLIYVAEKYLLAIAGYSLLAICRMDFGNANLPEKLENATELYDYIECNLLGHDRLEHLFTLVAEERHWIKTGKGKYSIGDAYDFKQLDAQIELFHRENQPKTLRRPYGITAKGEQ
ncbi:MAG: hypothetical protein ACTSYJ_03605 [Candidatus Thorarchaeota archaeon]